MAENSAPDLEYNKEPDIKPKRRGRPPKVKAEPEKIRVKNHSQGAVFTSLGRIAGKSEGYALESDLEKMEMLAKL